MYGAIAAECPQCHAADWQAFYGMESRNSTIARLRLAVRDMLKVNPFAGIGQDHDGRYIALVPLLCDRWIMNPALYGEFLGTVNDIEQIEPMLFGATGKDAIKVMKNGSGYKL